MTRYANKKCMDCGKRIPAKSGWCCERCAGLAWSRQHGWRDPGYWAAVSVWGAIMFGLVYLCRIYWGCGS